MYCDSKMRHYVLVVLIVLFSQVLVSCGGGGGGSSSTSPTISGFTTDVTTISAGASINLTAVFANGTGTIDNGVGGVTSSIPVPVTPSSTTTYTLTVTNAAGASVTSTITITVNASGVPTVTSFIAGTATIPAGSSVNLSAVFTGGAGSIDNGIGSVTSGSPISVSPITTTTYTLTVTNASGSVTSKVTVNVLGLDALSVSGATLDQFFQPNQLAYTATVGFVTSSITVTATTSNAGATIMVNGIAIGASGVSQSITLVEGVNPAISIVVTAADSTTITYTIIITRQFAATFAQKAYIKSSSNEAPGLRHTALDGDTLVVGAFNGAYVFTRNAGVWSQQAYLTASNAERADLFGSSVAISGDTIAVSAGGEQSNATGVNGDETNNSLSYAGAVYIFTRTAGVWSQQAYIKASNPDNFDDFGGGHSAVDNGVALDGDTLVVGAQGEQSNSTGINGNQLDNSVSSAGAVYVFTRSGSTWSQQAYLKASNISSNFGNAVGVSGDTIAVGAHGDFLGTGAVFVFTRAAGVWSQQAKLIASNAKTSSRFGSSVAIDGDTIAAGAPEADSNSGAAYVFTRIAGTWSQQAYIKASVAGPNDGFGDSIALSSDRLVVGAPREASAATGVNGDPNDNSASFSGAAYIFTRTGDSWIQQAYLKASNTNPDDYFGEKGAVSVSGETIVVSANREDSAATGINGDQSDNSASGSGAVYVFQ